MSDKKISQLLSATDLHPDGIVPISQIDPNDGILKTFGVSADKFSHGFFTFPNDTQHPILQGDVGKLAMNDGSGTAKVYKLSDPVPPKPGDWQITLDSNTYPGLSTESILSIKNTNSTVYDISQTAWRNGTSPTTNIDELVCIKDSIDTLIAAHGLSLKTELPSGSSVLTIKETVYAGTNISMQKVAEGTLQTLQSSLPPLLEAGTAFPLGKVVGLKGSDVLISNAYIETYTIAAGQSIVNTGFNSNALYTLDLRDNTILADLIKIVAIPGANGTVRSLPMDTFGFDQNTTYVFRDQLMGLILAVNGTEATVMHINAFGPMLNIILKTIWATNQR